MPVPNHSLAALTFGIILMLCAGAIPSANAQDARIRNVNVVQEGKKVVIQYDLLGRSEATYDVNLRLSRNGGATFDYIPTATSGAVRGGISPGRDKEIGWAVLQDFSGGLEGQDFQFKVIARREEAPPSRQPTAQRPAAEQDPELSSAGDRGPDNVDIKVGGGLSYNARQSIEVQFYDGYQGVIALGFPKVNFEIKASYRNNVGVFSQEGVLDVDLLYDGGFYYLGAGGGAYSFEDDFFDFESNSYNLNGVVGVRLSFDWIRPYVEYRVPFSRKQRDDMLSGGVLFAF
jgi:hypothetical protein